MSSFWIHGAQIRFILNHTGPDDLCRDLKHSTTFRVDGKIYDFPNVGLNDATEIFEKIILSEMDGRASLPNVIYCVYSTYQTYCCIDWEEIEKSNTSRYTN